MVGEHAVVYGEPALAMPLSSRRIYLRVEPLILSPQAQILVNFPALGLDCELGELPANHPISKAVSETLTHLNILQTPSCKLHYNAQLPIGSGLGSSAAMAVATIRGLSNFLGHPLEAAVVNKIAYESEKLVHGNPSGIDNTVAAYEKPVLFQKGKELRFVKPAAELCFILADSGIQKSTRETVAQLAAFRDADPSFVLPRIAEIGRLSISADGALSTGNLTQLAESINRNQVLLQELDISCPELDQLVSMALNVGASAAKVTGGGRGGHVLALVEKEKAEQVLERMLEAKALNPFITVVSSEE